MRSYQELEAHFKKLAHLDHLNNICSWDEAVMMPTGGGASRADALSTLSGIAHEMLVDDRVGAGIERAKAEAHLNDWQKANLTLMEKRYLSATCLPQMLVEKMTKASMACEQAWRVMRQENNWKDFAPLLKEVIDLTIEAAHRKSELFQLNPYDVLLDEYSPGVTQKIIDPIFNTLKQQLPAMVKQIVNQQKAPTPFADAFAIDKQNILGLALMKIIGFDFNHGRLDVSHHPFCGGVSDDVRITTRYSEKEFMSSVMGVCHETGHAMYELGLPREWLTQPVGQALGMTVHESQSLLIEMQACRSKAFMAVLKKALETVFDKQVAFSEDNLYAHYTRVEPGFIRVDADEVCYPLHVIMRYEMEKELISGELSVDELPERWNSAMQAYLGLSLKDNNRDGVMQDVHWPSGAIGYFPAYTLGALTAAQLFQCANEKVPDIHTSISKGNFMPLMQWLKEQVHHKASRVSYDTLMVEATGKTLQVEPFLNHLKVRYQMAL